jgi:hypothetical protein
MRDGFGSITGDSLSSRTDSPGVGLLDGQIAHLLAAIISAAALLWVRGFRAISSGALLGRDTAVWYWGAAAVPIVHQAFVTLVWRTQLVNQTPTRLLGV